MNYQIGLVRTLGLGYVIVVVVGNIVGSGVFKKIAPMAGELHSSGWIIAAWVAAGLITLMGALSNAEVPLIAQLPLAPSQKQPATAEI